MIKKIKKILLMFLCVLFVLPAEARSGGVEVLQAYVSGDTLTVFTDGRLRQDSLKCAVSGQNAEPGASGRLSGGGVKVKTTVLADVAAAANLRGDIGALLEKLIENKPANEEFRIVAFGKSAEVIVDFTADRYDLANALGKIKWGGGKSRLYDAICDTFPNIAPDGNLPVFHRALVISGGGDDSDNAMTKEELFLKLKAERYPVDIVEAKSKNLAAIARVSGGRHYPLHPGSETRDELAEMLGVGDYYCYTATVPPAVLDGSVRQVDLGDGINKMSLDLKFPVYAPPIGDPEPKSEEVPPRDSEASGYVGAGSVFLAVAFVVIVVGLVRKKKKNKNLLDSGAGFLKDSGGGETEFFGKDSPGEKGYTIKLTDMAAPGKSWTFQIQEGDEILVGRAAGCGLRLEDRSVSREQCKIRLEDKKITLVDLGATNKTSVNGETAHKNTPLLIGDTIKFGRESLQVDYIGTPGKASLAADALKSIGKGKTALLF